MTKKKVKETVVGRFAFFPVKHPDGNVSLERIEIPAGTRGDEVHRPQSPLAICELVSAVFWDEVWYK